MRFAGFRGCITTAPKDLRIGFFFLCPGYLAALCKRNQTRHWPLAQETLFFRTAHKQWAVRARSARRSIRAPAAATVTCTLGIRLLGWRYLRVHHDCLPGARRGLLQKNLPLGLGRRPSHTPPLRCAMQVKHHGSVQNPSLRSMRCRHASEHAVRLQRRQW